MDVADVLDAAADYIRRYGHHKGDFRAPGGDACCVLGALSMVDNGIEYAVMGASKEARALRVTLQVAGPLSLAEWNDDARRTKRQVITALMEAAARVRTGEIK